MPWLMSTLLRKQATQILAGFGLIGTPHSQHKTCPGLRSAAPAMCSIVRGPRANPRAVGLSV